MLDGWQQRVKQEFCLSCHLDQPEIETQELNSLAAASGLFAMISGFSASRQSNELHLPLDLLARYQLTATQLKKDPPGAELADVVSYLANSGIEWFSQGLSGLGASPGMHLKLRWVMEARLLARISKSSGINLHKGHRFGPSDAWFAWRYCRKLGHS